MKNMLVPEGELGCATTELGLEHTGTFFRNAGAAGLLTSKIVTVLLVRFATTARVGLLPGAMAIATGFDPVGAAPITVGGFWFKSTTSSQLSPPRAT